MTSYIAPVKRYETSRECRATLTDCHEKIVVARARRSRPRHRWRPVAARPKSIFKARPARRLSLAVRAYAYLCVRACRPLPPHGFLSESEAATPTDNRVRGLGRSASSARRRVACGVWLLPKDRERSAAAAASYCCLRTARRSVAFGRAPKNTERANSRLSRVRRDARTARITLGRRKIRREESEEGRSLDLSAKRGARTRTYNGAGRTFARRRTRTVLWRTVATPDRLMPAEMRRTREHPPHLRPLTE